MDFSIVPVEVVSTRTISRLLITVENMELFKAITFKMYYLDRNGEPIQGDTLIEKVVVDKQDYMQWGSDDTYILNKLLTLINAQGTNISIIARADPANGFQIP